MSFVTCFLETWGGMEISRGRSEAVCIFVFVVEGCGYRVRKVMTSRIANAPFDATSSAEN
jgi:hypothetical protein